MEILICTDGSDSSVQSAKLVSMFDFPEKSKIVILGVSEKTDDIEKITASIDTIEKGFGPGYHLKRKIRYGVAVEEILDEVLYGSYNLVTLGGGARGIGLLQPQVGTTTSKLARKLGTHFLVSRNIPQKLHKILFCIGSGIPETESIKIGGEWISRTNSQIGLLHVLNITKGLSSTGADVEQEKLRLLENAAQQLKSLGCNGEITPLLKKGLVVDEVLKELKDGGYELLVIGAHYLRGQDRWQSTLFDDITDQLLNLAPCSLLII